MSDLVRKLSQGQHRVIASLRPERTVKVLKECLDRDYVLVKFTETRGGTELGFPLDPQRSDTSGADFVAETGRVTLVGELKLDFMKVRCIAHIELPSLDGTGHLEILEEGLPLA